MPQAPPGFQFGGGAGHCTGFITVRHGREKEDAFVVGSVLRAALQAGQPPLVDGKGVFSWWLRPWQDAPATIEFFGLVREVFEVVGLEGGPLPP